MLKSASTSLILPGALGTQVRSTGQFPGARSGWLSRTVLAVTFLGKAGSVVTLAVSCGTAERSKAGW